MGVCFDNPIVGQFVNARVEQPVVGGVKKYWCQEVTLDLPREELRKCAEELYDLTGGAVTLDPAAVDEAAMADVMTKVASLTRDERVRRDAAIKKALGTLKHAASAQIAFLMDCTGSMSSYIAAARDGIVAIQTQTIASAPKGSELTCAFVGYRDFGDSPVPTFPFSSDVKTFRAHLALISAEGGGDECEDVLGGLEASNALAWDLNIPTKILFHVADAPCHGTFFAGSGSYGDNHKDVDSRGTKTKHVLEDLCSKKGVQYIFLRINDRTTNMIIKYNELMSTMSRKPQITTQALSEAGDIVKIAVASTLTSISAHYSRASAAAAGSKSTYLSKVDAVVRDAVSKTKSRRREPPSLSLTPIPEASDESSASSVVGASVKGKPRAKIVEICSLIFPETISDLKRPLKMTEIIKRHFELDDGNDFDKGACRKVSRATDVTFDESVSYVLKLHIIAEDIETERCNSIGDLQCQAVAAYLANAFSKLEVIQRAGKSVSYLKSKLVKLKTHDGKLRYGSLERVLEGEFLKWCNNGHYQKGAADPDFSATLAAFTHWTHEVTEGYLMVVDVQGIRADDGKKFILTDPAIHCLASEKFGMLNLGADGMKAFWDMHACNEVCKALHLKKRSDLKSVKVGTLAA
jgi:hypothetical protein